jgi:apolipoprotein N-acyltransferase
MPAHGSGLDATPGHMRTRLAMPAAMLAMIGALWVGGWLLSGIAWTKPAGEPIEVSLLQGNIAQDMKWREDRVGTTLDTYWRMIEASGDAQLVVLPETALPMLSDRLPSDYVLKLVERARSQEGNILIGLVERSSDGNRYYNSVFSVGTAPVQVYRKQHLVPFGEFIPPLFGWVIEWLKIPLQDFSRGAADQVPMNLSGQKIAINICYEDVFGEEIIRQLPAATILVNVSNTAWFGRSLAQPQHLQIARMRALETGRPMLRSTNTGMTAVIDQRGGIVAVAEPFSEASLRATVQGHQGVTPFVRVGNHAAIGLALVLGLGCLASTFASIRTGRRRPR